MTVTELVRNHVRKLLLAPSLAENARRRRAREIVRAGYTVVQDVRVSATGWELRDFLTGAVIACGDDFPAGLDAALANRYLARDLYTEIPGLELTTPGIPPSLSRAIEEWVFAPSTPDEEIAEFVGWTPGRVRECL